jgi:UDP-glucose 4-epimerase
VQILITGGAGFIGSHLADRLVINGEKVVILDNLSTGNLKNIKHLENDIKIYNGDIRDIELVEKLTSDSDLVLHMAAALGVDNILENPIESISTNFYGSEIVLSAAQKFDKRIIIASTSEIYGKNLNQPLAEDFDRIIGTPQKLRWTYSDAKALEEASAYFLYKTKQLRVTTVRFFNTVGPRQSGKYGMVIPRFVNSALKNEPIEIYGDGNQSRVFCHVKDTVEAVLRLSANDKAIGEVYNVGGEGEISISELAELIKKIAGSDSKIIHTKYENAYSIGFEDMARRVPDISKVRNLTGWSPKISLQNIIEDIINSLNHRNLGQP